MIVRLLLAIAIIIALFLFLRWFQSKPPHQVSQALKQAALFTVIGLIIFLAISGRLHWLFALLASLLPFLKRLLPLLRYLPLLGNWLRHYRTRRAMDSGPPPGQTSQVETRFIRMILDHDNGQIDGTILTGPLAGKRLRQLELEQLLACWQQWHQQDQESLCLLEAFLDQTQGPQWREQVDADSHQAPAETSSAMSADEALAILGLEQPLSRDTIIQAHRHLISRFHPDRGGSTYLAAKINQAKDLLLKHLADTA